jgi:hypothetical protein
MRRFPNKAKLRNSLAPSSERLITLLLPINTLFVSSKQKKGSGEVQFKYRTLWLGNLGRGASAFSSITSIPLRTRYNLQKGGLTRALAGIALVAWRVSSILARGLN